MLTLAASLPPGMATLAFPDHAAGRELAGRAGAIGLPATVSDLDDPATAVAASPAEIVYVHAGIGWEGYGLVTAAAQAGRAVIRTEHLPWLLTDPVQIRHYADAARGLDAVIAVSQAAAAGWRAAMSGIRRGVTVHAVTNGTLAPQGRRRPDPALRGSVRAAETAPHASGGACAPAPVGDPCGA